MRRRARIERGPERVPKQIECQHWSRILRHLKHRQPPGIEQKSLAAVEHAAPTDYFSAAQTKKAQGCFEKNRLPYDQAASGQGRRQGVGYYLTGQIVNSPRAEATDGIDQTPNA